MQEAVKVEDFTDLFKLILKKRKDVFTFLNRTKITL